MISNVVVIFQESSLAEWTSGRVPPSTTVGDRHVRIPGIQQIDRNGKRHEQVMHAKKYLGFFSTFGDALEAKATEMGMTSATLKHKYMMSSKSSK